MEVLNEYIAYVPIINLWHLWSVFVFLLLVGIVFAIHKQEGVASAFVIVSIVLMLVVAVPISASPYRHLERQGYISDPVAFVEMLDDWELIARQDSLFTIRNRNRMTEDEIKEWEKYEQP